MQRFILRSIIASSGGPARIIAAIGVNIFFFTRGKLKYIVIEKKNTGFWSKLKYSPLDCNT